MTGTLESDAYFDTGEKKFWAALPLDNVTVEGVDRNPLQPTGPNELIELPAGVRFSDPQGKRLQVRALRAGDRVKMTGVYELPQIEPRSAEGSWVPRFVVDHVLLLP